MLVPYGYFEIEMRFIKLVYDAFAASQCIYRASDLMEALTYSDSDEFAAVIAKAQSACTSSRIQTDQHFRPIYVASPAGLYRDYRLSRFACYLITMNADSNYPAVARAQVSLSAGGSR